MIILHTRKGQGYPATDSLSKIHHITVPKEDAQEAYDFYEELLMDLEGNEN